MSYSSLEEIRTLLPDYMAKISKPSKGGMWCCPLCGSGTGRHHTGALKIYPDDRFYCFSCGSHGDIIDLISMIEHVDAADATRIAIRMFSSSCTMAPSTKALKETESIQDDRNICSSYVRSCISAWSDSRSKTYLEKRGIDHITAERFLLKYDRSKDLIIIPYNKQFSYYIGRAIKEKRFYKPLRETAGGEPIYNAAALKERKPVFVIESPIDAISITMVSKANAVALGGTGIRKLTDHIDENGIEAPLILSFDQDAAGIEADKKLSEALHARNVRCIKAEYSGTLAGCKDANEMLVKDRQKFKQDIANNITRIFKEADR